LKIWASFLIVAATLTSGCALWRSDEPALGPTREAAAGLNASNEASQGLSTAEFRDSGPDGTFSKSEFIAQDFLGVILRIPSLNTANPTLSTSLPRSRYGEVLMESLRSAGFTLVLGPSGDVPQLSYDIDLPIEESPDVHTFYVSVGDVHLKRSYEIVNDRIAPTTEMLMAGIDAQSLIPADQSGGDAVAAAAPAAAEAFVEPVPDKPVAIIASASSTSGIVDEVTELKVPYLNELLEKGDEWDPLASNMYESRTSVYEPVFEDATVDYKELSSQVLVFPNDSLVLGDLNKQFLFSLAENFNDTTDVIRVIGCSHGKTALVEGNQKLARGRSLRVREELLLAGLDASSVLHEACWANQHFDEMMPRRGVVVMHLREDG